MSFKRINFIGWFT